jgi:hypothetical protein
LMEVRKSQTVSTCVLLVSGIRLNPECRCITTGCVLEYHLLLNSRWQINKTEILGLSEICNTIIKWQQWSFLSSFGFNDLISFCLLYLHVSGLKEELEGDSRLENLIGASPVRGDVFGMRSEKL